MLGGYNKPTAVSEGGSEEMTSVDILQEVIKRKLTGVMFHDDLQTAFDYLNMHGFKREQEYRTMAEFAEFKSLCRYVINRYEVMPCKHADRVEVNPANLKNATSRSGIASVQKKQSLKVLFETWAEWEAETIALLEAFVTHLAKCEHNADAMKVRELLIDTTMEYKYLERRIIEYNDVEWGMHHIYREQEAIHKHYKEKMKEEFKINLC